MKIEIVYRPIRTAEIEVDDKYKTMLNDDKAWYELISPLSETVVKEIQKIESDYCLNDDDILSISDVETDEIIDER